MNNIPWLPYLAIEYIQYLDPNSVFEWGSGGSTLWFMDRLWLPQGQLITVEHSVEWADQLKKELKKRRIKHSGFHLIYPNFGEIGPDKSDPAHYKSGATDLGAVNFKDYVEIIHRYDTFDLILIDGMARASCIANAIEHVNPGGCIVIDNTNDRPYYLEKTAYLFGNYEDGWERVDIMGYGPILDYKWQTTFFINHRKADYE